MRPPADPQRIIASRLREARETIGLTQEDVGQKIGIHRTAVVELEAGRRNVTGLELRRLSRLYRRPVAWLLGDDDPEIDDRKLIAATAHLPESDRDQVLRFARFLIHEAKGGGE